MARAVLRPGGDLMDELDVAPAGVLPDRFLYGLPRPEAWIPVLLQAPSLLLVDDFFASNMFLLPALFLLALAVGRTRLAFFERALLFSMLAVWAFSNLAPPYEWMWQLRGVWIARLYEPSIGVLLTVIARSMATQRNTGSVRGRFTLTAGSIAAGALGTAVVLGPWVSLPLYTGIYQRFYQHDGPDAASCSRSTANGRSASAG